MKKLTLLFSTIVLASGICLAQTSGFTYQGKLADSGSPANGQYDFTFKLFPIVSGGAQIGADVVRDDVQVTTGVFTVSLDFGSSPFISDTARYLEIAVRPGASTGAYTTLAPRQPITSSPFSIRTLSASSTDSLSSACVLCITDAHIAAIDGSKVTGTVANATNATTTNSATTAGNVTGIVQVSNGGTGSTTQNFVDLTTNQRRIGGDKEFTGTVSVTGATGVFNGNGSRLTNLNGANLNAGSVTAAQLSPNVVQSNLSLLGSLRWDLLKGQNDFPVGSSPTAVAFDGANIWTANYDSHNVTKLRASDGANLGTFPVGSNPIGIAFDGANIWTMNNGSHNVTKLRASDGANLGTFPAGLSPRGIAFDGANMWISNSSSSVTKLRASDGVNLGTFPIGNQGVDLAFDGANMWITNGARVTKLRATDGANLGSFLVVADAVGIAFDGASIWVVNSNSGNVTKLRASDGVNLGTFTVATFPDRIAFDGANMWITSSQNQNVTKLRASDGVNLGTFPVGTIPQGIAFDGANIWVTQRNSDSVTRLPPAFP